VTADLTAATPNDEVVVILESPGGVVHGYGLAASQLQRFKDHRIALTVAVDKVAAFLSSWASAPAELRASDRGLGVSRPPVRI
jgi:ClpP class serine protease